MTVAELLGSAILRIDRITRSLRGEQMDRLEAAGIPEDILKMKEEYAALDDSLQLSVFFINDQWPAIENNRARLGELRCFADGFGRFCSTVTAFDDAVIADEPSAWKLLGEYEASREYATLAGKYTSLLRPAFEYEQSVRPGQKPRLSPLQGLCEDLQDYFTGKTDKDLEDALLKGLPGGPKGTWNGTLTQATYFGQHFKVSAQTMNKLFSFTGKYGQPEKAHYTKYKANKILPESPFAVLLSKYPRKG